MGYYTNYNLTTINSETDISSILHMISDVEYSSLFSAMDENGYSIENVKWYDHEEDMKKLSTIFDDTIFELSGEGEETGDLWKKYFFNGKVQKAPAIIKYDDYDPMKLE